jgi:hypothetical protein
MSVTSTPMIVSISQNATSTPRIIGQLHIIDPDVNENFSIKLDKPNFKALTPVTNPYSVISNDGSIVYVRIIFRDFIISILFIHLLGPNV